ncbi:MAG: hypothetical protein H7Z75_04265 [Ferruginibacter sp.]|nr:hypothetical protein [Cytophagales bacterium]
MQNPRSTRRSDADRKLNLGVLLLFCLLLTGGCGVFDKIRGTIKDTVAETTAALDDAIDQLSGQSANWQQTLRELTDKLTDEAQSTVRNEVNNLVNRAVATTGTEFRCDADFLRNRLRQELMRIKSNLLRQPVPLLEPVMCQVVPAGIDLSLDANRRGKAEFFGYDFDRTAIKVYLSNGTQKIDVTHALSQPTHYHLVLNLGSNGVLLDRNSHELVLSWNNKEVSSIPVIQPQPEVCKVTTVSHEPGEVDFTPPHVGGDRDFDGNGPRVNAEVSAYVENNTVKARIYMKAVETKSDYTRAEGSRVVTLYTAPNNLKIEKITSGTTTSHAYTDSNHELDVFNAGNGELVKRFEFTGDGDDNEAGTRTKVRVKFNPMRIELKERSGCVTPQLLVRMQRDNQLDTKTVERVKQLPQVRSLMNQ